MKDKKYNEIANSIVQTMNEGINSTDQFSEAGVRMRRKLANSIVKAIYEEVVYMISKTIVNTTIEGTVENDKVIGTGTGKVTINMDE
ncbi:hypothetical protein N9251_00665 [Gammaproteobacteria bacterium]|nr:hypothetical protein [Gammaproteobacteria bacterium]